MPCACAIDVFRLKLTHAMCCPEIPGREVIAGHASLFFQIAIEFVEEMGIDPDTRRYSEIARG